MAKTHVLNFSLFAAMLIVMSSASGCLENASTAADADQGIVGTWEMTTQSQRGTRTAVLVINKDLSGTYTRRERTFPVNDLSIEGDQVSFKVLMKYQEREFELDFTGKLQGDSLNGQWANPRGTREVTVKRIDPK